MTSFVLKKDFFLTSHVQVLPFLSEVSVHSVICIYSSVSLL